MERFGRRKIVPGYHELIQAIFRSECPIWLFFDDAQDTFWDEELWSGPFKEVMNNRLYTPVRIVCFAAYGSPAYWNNPDPHGTPQPIPPQATMGLSPTNLVNHALRFTEEEFHEFMKLRDNLSRSGRNPSFRWTVIDDDLKDYVLTSSIGHIGAIVGLMGLAADAAVRGIFDSFVLSSELICDTSERPKQSRRIVAGTGPNL
jgi:hypothetical protein